MARSRLRRGCHCHAVHSVLYVGPSQDSLDSANNAGQVSPPQISQPDPERCGDIKIYSLIFLSVMTLFEPYVSPGLSVFANKETAVPGFCCVHM